MSFVNRKFFGLVVLVLVMAGFCAPCLHAQTNYGAVRGLAKDSQGAVIPDADVTLTNTGTKIVRTGKTNDSGEYLQDFQRVDHGRSGGYGDCGCGAGGRRCGHDR
jgi:trimeric autotransporter adhesin